MYRLVIVTMMAACARPAPREPVRDQPDELLSIKPYEVRCDYAYTELPMYSPPSHQQDAPIVHAHEAARAHHATATQAITDRKPAVAANEFLACARAYAAIGDDDPERTLAQKSAELCIGDALYAYATAGELVAIGKGELEKLAAEDARLKPAIDARLAKPPSDCPPP